jgi:hypothetical protein
MTLPETAGASLARTAWVPERRATALILLVAGIATLATSFVALPGPVLAIVVGVWCVAVAWFAQTGTSPIGFTVLSVCVKTMTLVIIALMILDPASPIGARNGLYWIPLGLLNMGSGLWFLAVIRKRAR